MTPSDTNDPSIAEEIAEVQPRLVEHYNATYADAVDIIGRAHLSDAPRTSTLIGIDVAGLMVRSVTSDGERLEFEVPFSRSATTLMEVETLTLEVIATARDNLGIAELSTPEAQAQQVAGVRTYVTSVVRVEKVSPLFAQVTLGGGDLTSYVPGGHDQFLYVMTPPVGRSELTVDSSFSREDFGRFTEKDRPVGAYYTLRRWRPEDAEIDMLFVLHGVDDDTRAEPGRSAQWAAAARPGDPVALWGPRTVYVPPAETDWVLLVGDETGLPAIRVILENLPEDVQARVFVEVGDEADRLPLPERPGIQVTWVVRHAPAGTTTVLADAVRTITPPEGNVYAWGGAEARSMRSVTRFLRRELGIARERVRMVGYWRHISTPADLNTEGD